MSKGMGRSGLVRAFLRAIFVITIAAATAPLGCASVGNDGSNDASWTCFKTKDAEEPCQCQTTPVGGKQEIVDHCGPDSVAPPAEAECCKLWLWLGGKPQTAYYCSCYDKGSKSCNTSNGDEVVDRCP